MTHTHIHPHRRGHYDVFEQCKTLQKTLIEKLYQPTAFDNSSIYMSNTFVRTHYGVVYELYIDADDDDYATVWARWLFAKDNKLCARTYPCHAAHLQVHGIMLISSGQQIYFEMIINPRNAFQPSCDPDPIVLRCDAGHYHVKSRSNNYRRRARRGARLLREQKTSSVYSDYYTSNLVIAI